MNKFYFVCFVSLSLQLAAIAACVMSFGCSRQGASDKLLVAVSIPPQAWFVSQVAGDKADSLVLVPPGQSPHNYEPTPKQIKNLSKASVWILSGTDFEISLRPKIENLFPDIMIVDGTDSIEYRYHTEHEHHDCDDDSHGSHSTFEIDRHTWLGYDPAINMAMKITTSLAILDHQNSDYYFERMDDLIKKVDLVYNRLRDTLAPLEGKRVFVYHPSFGYFLDDFGIIQEAVEISGKEPTARQLNDLIEKMHVDKPVAIFVQKQFPSKSVKTVAQAVGAKVIELDPLAPNWLENIMSMGQELKILIK